MADIVNFPGKTKGPISVEKILGDALEDGMDTAVVIGWDSKKEFWFQSSSPDIGEVLLLLALAQRKLVEEVADDGT